MKCILVFSFLLLSIFSVCQNRINPIHKGIYSGGVCLDNAICGNWILRSDSTFIFIQFENGNLKTIGMGNWITVENNSIKFNFRDKKLIPILRPAKTEYYSETKEPFDSVFISGQLKAQNGDPVHFPYILYNRKYQIIGDASGNFKGVFPRTLLNSELLLMAKLEEYIPVEINLSAFTNVHKINVSLIKEDSTTCYSLYDSNPLVYFNYNIKLKINQPTNKKTNSLGLTFISEDTSLIISKLISTLNKQPYLKNNITELIDLIKK